MFSSVEHDLQKQKYKAPRRKNLNKQKYQTIKDLRHNIDIIIKPADKGSAIVIMDKEDYIKKDERQVTPTSMSPPAET